MKKIKKIKIKINGKIKPINQDSILSTVSVSYTHLTLPTTPYV